MDTANDIVEEWEKELMELTIEHGPLGDIKFKDLYPPSIGKVKAFIRKTRQEAFEGGVASQSLTSDNRFCTFRCGGCNCHCHEIFQEAIAGERERIVGLIEEEVNKQSEAGRHDAVVSLQKILSLPTPTPDTSNQ